MHSAKRGLCCSNVTRGLCLVLGGFVVVVCGGGCTVEERTVVSVCLVSQQVVRHGDLVAAGRVDNKGTVAKNLEKQIFGSGS